ncbi:hypothetical protein BA920_08355, partial [Helicobacter pullorum]|uniref:filamentous hemagglutinin N-terminal domain-containing protein n=1 Tax=Helicobacter pullorum TaxID=35818 RepID=UPI000816A725
SNVRGGGANKSLINNSSLKTSKTLQDSNNSKKLKALQNDSTAESLVCHCEQSEAIHDVKTLKGIQGVDCHDLQSKSRNDENLESQGVSTASLRSLQAEAIHKQINPKKVEVESTKASLIVDCHGDKSPRNDEVVTANADSHNGNKIKQIGISIIASLALSQSLLVAAPNISNTALPSGGKFTSGKGSITTTIKKVNGKDIHTMNITGHNTNHVITWGGGFNIGKDAVVNFKKQDFTQSFLNLDYSNKASQILGKLNGNNHNIYLVNPSGVLIGQGASINANKFVASNTIDENTLNQFKNKVNDSTAITSFSPVYKPNKGNVVNLGHIKAKEGITLIGNTVDIRGGKLENTAGGTNKNNSIYFVGENIYIDADATSLSSNNNVYATAFSEGYIQRQMKNFQKDNFQFGNFNNLITNEKYDYQTQGNLQGSSNNFKKAITLGNMGDSKANVAEWSYFADFINGVKTGSTKPSDIDEYRLVGDIDFGGINYADYNGSSLIVGKDSTNAFTSSFNGNGYKLSNIDIEMTQYQGYIGVFGNAKNATISNLGVENIDIDLKTQSNTTYKAGSLLGYASDVKISDIFVKNVSVQVSSANNHISQDMIGGFIGEITAANTNFNLVENVTLEGLNIEVSQASKLTRLWLGGFFGNSKNVNVSNVAINDVKNIKANTNTLGGVVSPNSSASIYLGGFTGLAQNNQFENISITNIVAIEGEGMALQNMHIGGFAGWGYAIGANNIELKNIQNIAGVMQGQLMSNMGNNYGLYVGGFGGIINNQSNLSNISLDNVKEISSKNTLTVSSGLGANDSRKTRLGGFAGYLENNKVIENISINQIDSIIDLTTSYSYVGGFGGEIKENKMNSISFNSIGEVKGTEYVGGFAGNITAGTITNIIMNDFCNIVLDNAVKTGMHYVGGFVGNANGTNILLDNIALNNFGIISGKHEQQVGVPPIYIYSGGFAGRITGAKANHIAINGIEKISAERKEADNTDLHVGGFSGYISGSSISNVILNGIKNLNATYITSKNPGNQVRTIQMGGFAGYIISSGSATSFENIYLYFDANAAMTNDVQHSAGGSVKEKDGKFYGQLSGNNTSFNNIHFYYKDGSLINATADSSNSHNVTNGSVDNSKINLHTYVDSTQAINNFHSALEKENSQGGAFESNPLQYTQDSNGNYIYSFANTTGANVTPPTITPPSGSGSTTNPDSSIDLGNVTLEQEDFVGIETTIQEIINEILNESYHINITGFDVATMQLGEISSMINEILKGIQTKQSEDMLDYKINQLFNLLLVSNDSNKVESLKQSLNFLRAFYDGENGLKGDFAKWYSKDNSIDKYSYVKDSILKLKSFINGEGNYNGNGLINQISSINNNLKALESLK